MDDVQIHRTWVQLLVERGHRDVAAIAVDVKLYVGIEYYRNALGEYEPLLEEVIVDVPVFSYDFVVKEERIRRVMEQVLLEVLAGYAPHKKGELMFSYRVKLMEAEKGWEKRLRELLSVDTGDEERREE